MSHLDVAFHGGTTRVVLRSGKACGRPDKKFCATVGNKKVFFGQAGASDYTIHKTPTRMLDYVRRHGESTTAISTA